MSHDFALLSPLCLRTNVDIYVDVYIVGVTFVIFYVLTSVCTPPILAPSAWIHSFVIHSQPFVSTSLPSSPIVLYSMTIIYVYCYFFFVAACLRSFTVLALPHYLPRSYADSLMILYIFFEYEAFYKTVIFKEFSQRAFPNFYFIDILRYLLGFVKVVSLRIIS